MTIQVRKTFFFRIAAGIGFLVLFYVLPHMAEAALLIKPPLYIGLNSGLIAEWSFDSQDMFSTTVFDQSGSGFNGALTSGPTQASGRVGQGLAFDGSDDSVVVTGLLGSPANITISGWFKLDAADSAGAEFISIGDYVTIRLDDPAGVIGTMGSFYDGTDWNETESNLDYAGKGWHHIVYVMNDTLNEQKVYIDNVVIGQSTFSTSIQYSGQGSNTIMGRHANGGTTFDFRGTMDDIRVYNRALTAQEIKRLYNIGGTLHIAASQNNKVTNGLVGIWSFDGQDMFSSTAYDRSGNGNNGSISGATRSLGNIGQGLRFDGVDDFVNVGDPASGVLDFGTATSFTLSVWVKSANAAGSARFFDKGLSGGSVGYDVQFDGGTGTVIGGIGATDGAYFQYRGSTNVADNQWHHVVNVFDQTAKLARQYVDGQLQSLTENGSTCGSVANVTTYDWSVCSTISASSAVGLHFGSSQGSGEFLNGTLDDARIYNRALTHQEIKRLYNIGGTLHLAANQNNKVTSGLIGLWSFDSQDMFGTTAYDRSESGNNGTLTDGSIRSAGRIGQGLSFDGVDDRVATGSDTIGSGDDTISAWFKPNSLGEGSAGAILDNTKVVLSLGSSNKVSFGSGGAAGGGGPIAEVGGGSQRATRVCTSICDSSTLAFPGSVTSGNLLIVTGAVWDDGGAPTSNAITDTRGTSYTVIDGTPPDGNTRTFIAYGIAPSSGANTVTVNPSNHGSSRASSYSIDEFSGVDTSTPLDVNGGSTLDNDGNPIRDSITTATANALIIGVMTHVNADTTLTPTDTQIGENEDNNGDQAHNAQFRVVTTATTYNEDWTMGVTGDTAAQTASFKEATGGGGTVANSATGAFALGDWTHVLVTRTSAGVANIYINGVLSGTADQGSGTPAAGAAIQIGNNSGGTATFDGAIDDVRTYNRVLNAQEIKRLYNIGR